MIDQVAVPQDTNEEAAVAAHLTKMDLTGVCITTDAAHLTKANCRQLTQNNSTEFFIFLKANQPTALAKAEQLLPGDVRRSFSLDTLPPRLFARTATTQPKTSWPS